jgi:hypothetical protein
MAKYLKENTRHMARPDGSYWDCGADSCRVIMSDKKSAPKEKKCEKLSPNCFWTLCGKGYFWSTKLVGVAARWNGHCFVKPSSPDCELSVHYKFKQIMPRGAVLDGVFYVKKTDCASMKKVLKECFGPCSSNNICDDGKWKDVVFGVYDMYVAPNPNMPQLNSYLCRYDELKKVVLCAQARAGECLQGSPVGKKNLTFILRKDFVNPSVMKEEFDRSTGDQVPYFNGIVLTHRDHHFGDDKGRYIVEDFCIT